MPFKAGPGLLFVLVCAMGAGPVMNYGISAASTLIIADLGISEGRFGLLATACFLAAALCSVSLGRLSDRISARTQMLIIFGGTALALLLMAVSGSYWWLLAAAALAGPAQAISNPTTNRIISQRVEPARRPGWLGIKQSGVQGSQLFSSLFFPAVALVAGWRGAAVGAALVLGLLLVYAWRHLPPELPSELIPAGSARGPAGGSEPGRGTSRPAAASGRPEAGGRPAGSPARDASRKYPGAVWLLAAFALFSGAGMQATNVYLPLFAQRELEFPLLLAGATAAAAGVIGVASRVLWGRRMAGGVEASTLLVILALGALAGVGLLLAAGQTGAPALLWAGVALHGATVLGVNVVVMAGVLRLVPTFRVGAASGVVSLGMYSGFALGPLAMGTLLELSGHFLAGWIFVAAGYALCLALGVLLAVRRRGAQAAAGKPERARRGGSGTGTGSNPGAGTATGTPDSEKP